uniref:hypothetical protein n=2 Tax=Desulfobacula sp. TaxID=2593537 RepID=UPI0026061FEA
DWSDDGRGWETPQETEGISSGNLNLPAPIITLFDFFRFRDGDGVPGETIETCDPDVSGGSLDPLANSVWTATVPIYDDGDTCDAPNKTLSIVGYATIQILEVNPDGTIKVCVPCDTTAITGQGGGGDIGNLLAIIPDLVQ